MVSAEQKDLRETAKYFIAAIAGVFVGIFSASGPFGQVVGTTFAFVLIFATQRFISWYLPTPESSATREDVREIVREELNKSSPPDAPTSSTEGPEG